VEKGNLLFGWKGIVSGGEDFLRQKRPPKKRASNMTGKKRGGYLPELLWEKREKAVAPVYDLVGSRFATSPQRGEGKEERSSCLY